MQAVDIVTAKNSSEAQHGTALVRLLEEVGKLRRAQDTKEASGGRIIQPQEPLQPHRPIASTDRSRA
jgi:hypothetical protein